MKKNILVFGYLILIIIALSMLFPFFAMLNLSLVSNSEIFSYPPKFFHTELTVDNFLSVFDSIPITRYFLNSLIVSSMTTIWQVLFSAFAGYAFARLRFPGRNIIFAIFLITMMVPPQVNIVPLFFLMREFHLIDTYQALILPGIFGGFGVFMFRQHFLNMPNDLDEAAKIDGCNIFTSFIKITLPLSLPIIATLAIFTFVSSWNSFMWPLIVTNSETMRTLPLGLAVFKGSFREVTNWGDLLAGAVICTVPVVLVFLAGQKYFLNDLLQGGIKE